MRTVGYWVGRMRGMARHFTSGIETMMREAELEEMEKKWREENERIMQPASRRRALSRAGHARRHAADREPGSRPQDRGLPPRAAAAAVKDIDDTKQPLLEHLIELRRRCCGPWQRSRWRSSSASTFARDIFAVLVQPLLKAGQGRLIYTDIFEAFFVEVKVGAVRGADDQLPGYRDAAVAVRRAGPLRQGKEGVPAVPADDAVLFRGRALASLILSPCRGRCISC